MDTLLIGGDHAVDGRGIPISIEGEKELLQRALIRLCTRKGALECAPQLGSELYRLQGVPSSHIDQLAMRYVQEALSPLKELHVLSVETHRNQKDVIEVAVIVSYRNQSYHLEVDVI